MRSFKLSFQHLTLNDTLLIVIPQLTLNEIISIVIPTTENKWDTFKCHCHLTNHHTSTDDYYCCQTIHHVLSLLHVYCHVHEENLPECLLPLMFAWQGQRRNSQRQVPGQRQEKCTYWMSLWPTWADIQQICRSYTGNSVRCGNWIWNEKTKRKHNHIRIYSNIFNLMSSTFFLKYRVGYGNGTVSIAIIRIADVSILQICMENPITDFTMNILHHPISKQTLLKNHHEVRVCSISIRNSFCISYRVNTRSFFPSRTDYHTQPANHTFFFWSWPHYSVS